MVEVLWIDDQHQEDAMEQLLIAAEGKDIRLNGYASYEAGFEVLEKNLDRFDCILLDGLFFKKKGQEKGTEDTTGIGAAINHINRLAGKKEFPWFVLSGKDKFTSGENDLLKANEAMCFDKSNLEDIDRLFEEIKNVCENLETFQIRKKYADILEVCEDRFLGQAQFSRVFAVLECIENGESIESLLTDMRMVLEKMFERLHALGLVPQESPNRTAWFLSGTHNNYRFIEEFVHPLFAENVSHLLEVLQDGSHHKKDLKLRVQDYISKNSCHYFQQSIAYLFLDVLLGFLLLVKAYPDREKNILMWEESYNRGRIIKLDQSGFITLEDEETRQTLSFPESVASEIAPHLNYGTKVLFTTKVQSRGKIHIDRIWLK